MATKAIARLLDLKHLKGRIAVIGDTHGVWRETLELMQRTKADHIVFLGDLADKGPHFQELVKFAMGSENVYTLLGNHDLKLIRYLKGNKVELSNTMQATISQINGWSWGERQALLQWLSDLSHIVLLPKAYIGVHAGLDPTKDLREQNRNLCIYIRTFGPSGKLWNPKEPFWYLETTIKDWQENTVLFGHIITDRVFVAPRRYALDGGGVYGGELRAWIIDTQGGDDHLMTQPCEAYTKKTSIFG